VGLFTNDTPDQPTPPPSQPKRKKTKSTFSRSTQIIQAPKPSTISSVFTNTAQSASYSTPRTLTAAAAQIKVNDKLMTRVSSSNLEFVVLLDQVHGKQKHGNTTTQSVKSSMHLI